MTTQAYIRSELQRRVPLLPQDQILELESLLLDQFRERLTNRKLQTLRDEDLMEFGRISDEFDDDPEKVQQWIADHHPGHFAINHQELVTLLDEAVAAVNSAASTTSPAGSSAAGGDDDDDHLAPEITGFDSPFMSEQLPDWISLRKFLCEAFEGEQGKQILSLDIEIPGGAVQPVSVRTVNPAFAEVIAGLGLGLSIDQQTDILRALKRFVGPGAVLDGNVLLIRHAIVYHGLTRGSAFQTVMLVAGAASSIISEFNASHGSLED